MPDKHVEKIEGVQVSRNRPKKISVYEYWARVVKVVDGDTVDFSVSLGFDIAIDVRVRLLGVDAPEIFGVKAGTPEHRDGMAVKKIVDQVLRPGRWVELKIYHAKREKYGRWLGEIFVDGENLNRALVDRGYGYSNI